MVGPNVTFILIFAAVVVANMPWRLDSNVGVSSGFQLAAVLMLVSPAAAPLSQVGSAAKVDGLANMVAISAELKITNDFDFIDLGFYTSVLGV